MKPQPVVYEWRDVDVISADGEVVRRKAMVPLARYGNVCARQFADGGQYTLEPVASRSMASHSHYFAALQEGFDNLPEGIAPRFPSAEHLRKWLLVKTGWFDEREFSCPDEAFARRLGAFIRVEDEYASISVHRCEDNVSPFKLIVRRARSQSLASMGADDFQKSKNDVLDALSALIGTSVKDLNRSAGRSA